MDVSTDLGSLYNYINTLLSNQFVIIVLVVVLILYTMMFVSLGGSTSDQQPTSSSSSSWLVLMFVLIIFVSGLHYYFGYNVMATIKNVFSPTPELNVAVVDETNLKGSSPEPEIKFRKQVFNIPGNEYVYEDAKALCSAYGARLATYKEVEDTYEEGGEWCNYGWSNGQMALFPTQQKTFDKLQKIEGHENDCGRPGVNGGYIANPKVKFGVNCYGYKPRMTPEEEDLMANKPIYPKTMKDIAMENRVKYWKDKLSEILVSPFNQNSWSRL